MQRAEKLAHLPSNVAESSAFDDAALSTAVGEVAEAAQQLWAKSMEPAQWLEVRRCKLEPNLKAPGFKGST